MSERLRVGVYDLYWSTYGGGEQVAGSLAGALARHHDVTLLASEPVDAARARERLDVDVSRCSSAIVYDDVDASAASAEFDLFVNVTYLSRAVNHGARGWYYAHFPQLPGGRRQALRHRLGVTGVKVLSVPPRLPTRLVEVRAGFDRRVRHLHFVSTYQRHLANSRFTASWVERLWGVRADVLYPPVRPHVAPGAKRPTILNLGRFFHPRSGHSKKQLELIQAFTRAGFTGWTLALAGGCDGDNRDYVLAARRAAQGLPIELHVNARGEVVHRLLGEASLYWHAGGYGEDPERHPERFEHFGIAVVEAMAAGAVPLVFAAAGPAEIVQHGINGYLWETPDELIELSSRLIGDPALRNRLSVAAQQRAADFAAGRFTRAVDDLLRA